MKPIYQHHRDNAIAGYPPNIMIIQEVLPVIEDLSIIYAYGDKIYTPGGQVLTDDLIHHEMVHMSQQKELGPERWWRHYLDNPQFRLDQELEAYIAQWQFIKEDPTLNRERRRALKKFLIESICDPMYGGMLTPKQARGFFT